MNDDTLIRCADVITYSRDEITSQKQLDIMVSNNLIIRVHVYTHICTCTCEQGHMILHCFIEYVHVLY